MQHQEEFKQQKQDNQPIKVIEDIKNNTKTIEIYKRKYQFSLDEKMVNDDINMLNFLMNLNDYQNLMINKEKINHKNQQLYKLTQYSYFTAIEYYMMKKQNDIIKKMKKIDFKEQETCVICMCELYSEIQNYDYQKFNDQLQQNSDDDVVILKDCDGHYFHQNCIINCCKEQHLKCPICQKIYGVMVGDQPQGNMDVIFDKHINCQGYEKQGSIIITYNMQGGQKAGKPYGGTARTAYLPNNKDGQEVLRLLKIAFERKLIFTIGRSVTTGQEPAIVWNGIHHKTSPNGGTSKFGYPDPTYFNRVKEELGLKGVY